MGFLSRTFVPRSVRRAAHPVRSAKRVARKAVVPKPVRQASYTISQVKHPVSSASYHLVERPITTAMRSGGRRSKRTPVYTHLGCDVRHRTPQARDKCRNASVRSTASSTASEPGNAPHANGLVDPSAARSTPATAAEPSFWKRWRWFILGWLLITTGISGPFQDNHGDSIGTVIGTMLVAFVLGIACLRHHRRVAEKRPASADSHAAFNAPQVTDAASSDVQGTANRLDLPNA